VPAGRQHVAVHTPGGAAWLRVKVATPLVMVADLARPAFAAALQLIVPLPVPLDPLIIVSHVWDDDTVHEHSEAAVTVMLPVASEYATSVETGENESVRHGSGGVLLRAMATLTKWSF
jgi:hypothetical protein